jgi:hypothetical protein
MSPRASIPPIHTTSVGRQGDVNAATDRDLAHAAKLDKPEESARQTWCAVADATVPEPIAKAFETSGLAASSHRADR